MFFVRRAVARWTLGRVLEKRARYATQDFIAIELVSIGSFGVLVIDVLKLSEYSVVSSYWLEEF